MLASCEGRVYNVIKYMWICLPVTCKRPIFSLLVDIFNVESLTRKNKPNIYRLIVIYDSINWIILSVILIQTHTHTKNTLGYGNKGNNATQPAAIGYFNGSQMKSCESLVQHVLSM